MEVDQRNERAVNGAKRTYKTGNKVYSWYSRLSKVKKVILWLIAALGLLAVALGVGLGVGLSKSRGDGDEENDRDS